MSASQALKRCQPVRRSGPARVDPSFRKQVDDGWRAFWARRGRDVDSYGFRGGLGA